MAGREVEVAPCPGRDRDVVRFGELDQVGLGAGFPHLVADHDHRPLGLRQPVGRLLDSRGFRPWPRRHQETLRRDDLRADVLRFERAVGHREIDRPARRRGGHLVGPSQHHGQALRVAGLPAELGELPRDVLLVIAGPRREDALVAPQLVVQHARRDDQRGSVAARVVELAAHLGRARDDMDVDEPRLEAGAVVAVRHRDHDAFVQAHDQGHARGDLRVEQAHFERSRIREQVLRARRLGLLHDQLAAASRHLLGWRQRKACVGALGGVEALDERLRGRGREPKRGQLAGKPPPRKLLVEKSLDQLLHRPFLPARRQGHHSASSDRWHGQTGPRPEKLPPRPRFATMSEKCSASYPSPPLPSALPRSPAPKTGPGRARSRRSGCRSSTARTFPAGGRSAKSAGRSSTARSSARASPMPTAT